MIHKLTVTNESLFRGCTARRTKKRLEKWKHPVRMANKIRIILSRGLSLTNFEVYQCNCFAFIEAFSTSLSCEIIDSGTSFHLFKKKTEWVKRVCMLCAHTQYAKVLLFSNFCWNFNYFLLGFARNFYCSFVNRLRQPCNLCSLHRFTVAFLFSFFFFFFFNFLLCLFSQIISRNNVFWKGNLIKLVEVFVIKSHFNILMSKLSEICLVIGNGGKCVSCQ